MLQHQTFLRCSRTTATILIFTSILLFLLIGCASLFRSLGLSPDQAAQQSAELKSALEGAATAAIADVKTGLAEGHDLKTIAARASSAFIWKIFTAAAATIGGTLNILLAKWLGTEKKITASIIGAVETHANDTVKTAIKNHATAAGIEPQLHARVKALT